jgi:CheY-like chemotaxis protein
MPVMDGRQALLELRRDPVCHDIPVIMLTAMSGREIQRELRAIGISGYIGKPFKQDVFDDAVSRVLGPVERSAPAPVGQADAHLR